MLAGFSGWYVGKGGELNEHLQVLRAVALATTAQVMQELAADQKVFERFLVDTSRLVGRSAERRDDVSGFVTNTNTVFKAIGDENVALAQALEFLPGTLRRANTTFVELRGALDELNELTNVTKPFADELAPFFRAARQARRATSTPTFSDFADMIATSGKDNDLTDMLRNLPTLANVAEHLAPELDQGSAQVAEGDRVHPPIRRRLHGLDREVRAHDRLLRRQRPLRARPADIQRVHASRRTAATAS